ncbi:MAG: NAD(P)/FAD-dependent oxidoreductase [Pseudomonadota bacterium]
MSSATNNAIDKLVPYKRDAVGAIPEFPMESEFDVVIIGGGPNGLIAGAYLARAGLSVIVLEKRTEVGGGLATEEVLFPCYYTHTHAIYHMMTDYMPLLQDFDLSKHGVSFYTPNYQTGMVYEDGSSFVLCRSIDDTADSLRRLSHKDAETFLKLMRTWEPMFDEILGPATYYPPMPALEQVVSMQRTGIGKALIDLTEKTPLEVITELFENKKIQAAMLYCVCMFGLDPNGAGMGFLIPLLLQRAGWNKAYCNGGSHRLAAALAREIMAAGGMIMSPAPVTKILVANGRATGVEMYDGRQIKAKAVLSSLDPQQTFQEMVGPEHLDGYLNQTSKAWQYEKKSFFTTHAVLYEPPKYKADDAWVDKAFMTVMGFENVDELLQYWKGVKDGDISDQLAGHSTCETLIDPHLARVPPVSITPVMLDTSKLKPRAQHIAFFQMHAPYDLKGGWEKRTDEITEKVLERWRRYAPNMTKENMYMVHSETPVDIETRLASMRRGSFKHGDYIPFQMGMFRPNEQCSSGRTPIEGLYTCGASNYPGGLVLGGPGYLAANAVAENLEIKKWWKPTKNMRRYERVYLSK